MVLVFVLTGSMLLRWRSAREAPNPADAALTVAISAAVGIAIWAFEGLALGFAGLLNPRGVALVIVVNIAAIYLLGARRRIPDYLTNVWLTFSTIARSPFVILYCAMLLLSTRAALPDYTSDGVRFHLAYSYDWFQHARVFADLRFRFPFYAQNYEIIYSLLFVAGLGRYINFVNWCNGSLSVILVYAIVARIDLGNQERRGRWARAASFIAYILISLAVALSPIFVRWNGTAMLDTTYGFFFIVTIAAALRAVYNRDKSAVLACSLCAAFLVGAKLSFALLAVPSILLILATGLRLNIRRYTVACMAIFCILASPWYVRNLAQDGDPLPPVLNLAIRGHDAVFSKKDWAGISNDLHTSQSFSSVLSAPLRIFTDTLSSDFREYGANAAMLGIYLVLLASIALIFRRRGSDDQWATLTTCLFALTGFGYLVATSLLGRYWLLIIPTLLAAIGATLFQILGRFRFGPFSASAIAALMLIPSPGSAAFFNDYIDLNYRYLASVLPSDRAALERNLPGYKEAEPLFSAAKHGDSATVYLEQADLQYYAEVFNWHPIGDWVGPWRYSDLAIAIDDGLVSAYVKRHQISGFIMSKTAGVFAPEELDSLHEQLMSIGFRRLDSSDDLYDVYIADNRLGVTARTRDLR